MCSSPQKQQNRSHGAHKHKRNKHWPCMGLRKIFCICLMVVYPDAPVGLPTIGTGVFLTLLSVLRTSSSHWVVSSSLDTRVCAESYCALLGHVWWPSLGFLLLFCKLLMYFVLKGQGGGVALEEKRVGGRDWIQGREGKLQSWCNVWEKNKN